MHGAIDTPGRGSDDPARVFTGRAGSVRAATFVPRPHQEFLGMTAVIASQPMRHLLAAAARVARTGSPVLITGESGAGKELIARAVHHYSARSARPLVDVNCAAIPERLVESELFGCEKGAFSGADALRPGLFEAAHGGTLFLDEIGELDSHMQAKLLRVLDGHSYFRLGGSRKVLPDVRVIAATNLNIEQAVSTGRFRRDLFHRLDSFRLHVPPLRERTEDIAPLAACFLRDSPLTLSVEALQVLENYSWPGNVRELRNCLVRAALFARGPRIEPRDLFAEAPHREPDQALDHTRDQTSAEQFSLDSLERETIRRVLLRTGGHQQKAADLLGISRRTLIRKLKLYQVAGQLRDSADTAAAEQRSVA